MLIYFIKQDKINTFCLPKKVEGDYILFDYDSNGYKRSLVSVEAKEGIWYIKQNDEVKIKYNGSYAPTINLTNYAFYQLIVYGTENIVMYVSPAYDTSYVQKSLVNDSKIVLGNGNCDISYNYAGIEKKQLELNYKDGICTFKNLNTNVPIYINKIRKDSGTLKKFDTIFIMGFKLVYFGTSVYINNPSNSVFIVSNKFGEPQQELIVADYKATSEIYRDFYDERDYYFKAPVFQNSLNVLELTIASPPSKVEKNNSSLFMTLFPSIIMSASSIIMTVYSVVGMKNNPGSGSNYIMTLIMSGTMLFGSLVWPFIERGYSNLLTMRMERKRVKQYTKYLKQKELVLSSALDEQKMILLNRYQSVEGCKDIIKTKNSNLYSRNIDSPEFIKIRLGLGPVPLASKINFSSEEVIGEKEKMVAKAEELINKYKYIPDVPYTISLLEKNKVAFIGPDSLKENYLDAIVLQLLTYHSYNDLKIVALSQNEDSTTLNYLKESNHCWDDNREFRFFSTSMDDGQVISSYLEKVLSQRLQQQKENDSENAMFSPYYLLITDSISMYKNLKIVKDILSLKVNLGLGLLIFDSKIVNIPLGCSHFVDYNQNEASYFMNEMSSNNISRFKPDFIGNVDIVSCVTALSNIPIRLENTESGLLPDSLGFLEMNGVGKIEQLNCITRWQNSNVVNSLATPIGVDAEGNTLYLDLHETKHGPHGLIAGMTGSGKSEFIITYILSLALNYSPYEVQFVLIDYKGGGLAGAFENRKEHVKLPHLVGTITNLDKSEMNRTLVSINSELQRRQRIFNTAKEQLNTGTIDIYKYQKLVREGKLSEHLSHLFIICDEFAELKAQQPEFMDELISTARIGRSLGVHLILATQKPSGVVDEQIWSNTKFRVCCKVQTAEDSNEMIKRADAAYLKEAGRFYLQVGYDEYFVKGQSAYTGGPYVPSEKSFAKLDNGIDFINHIGEVTRSVVEKKKVEEQTTQASLGEELINVLHYLIEAAKQINYANQQLWLDSIPKLILLDKLNKKYSVKTTPFNINPLVGEYDNPQGQTQGPVEIPLTTKGNTYIAGVAGSGKSTLLSTIIYSTIVTHNVEEVNFYIIDLLAENLRKFSNAPQVGEFLTVNDGDKISKLFYFLTREANTRKKYYSINGGSFDIDVKNGKSIFPNIMVVINGMDVFKETFEKVYEELFTPFTRDCNRNGIVFVTTGNGLNTLGYMVENNFPTKIAMKFLDTSDYMMWFTGSKLIPNDNPGRGLIQLDNVYEFQTALPFEEDVMDKNINYVIVQLSKFLKGRAKKLPVLPNTINADSLVTSLTDLSSVPIGYEIKSACPYMYNFDCLISLVTSPKEVVLKEFANGLVYLFSKLENTKNIVLSAYDFMDSLENVKMYMDNFKNVLASLKKNIEKTLSSTENNNKYVITICGYVKLNMHLLSMKKDDSTIITIDDIILMCKDSEQFRFVILDFCDSLTSIDNLPWYNLVSTSNGILLSTTIDSQSLFVASEAYDTVQIARDDGIVILKSAKEYIKYVKR